MQQMQPDDMEFTLNTDWCGVELPTHTSCGAQSAERDFIFWNFLSISYLISKGVLQGKKLKNLVVPSSDVGVGGQV